FFYRERVFIFVASVVGHLLVIIFSKPLITTLYGEEYMRTVPIFNFLMLGSMIKYLTVFYMIYYNTNGKHKIQQIINILIAVVNIVLSVIFIHIFGLNGPAIATALTLLLSLIYSAFYCERRIRILIKEGEQKE